jgi:RNA polymerase sigma-70 factor (ECF subfamily)
MAGPLSTATTHASLIGRLKDLGDGGAWERFVRTYGPAVYDFCRRRGVQDADAIDLVQDVLSQVVVSIRSFEYDPSRGCFRDWLGAVTRSKLARHWRAAANRPERPGLGDDEIAMPGLEAEWAVELDAHLLRIAIEAIRPHFEPTNWSAFEQTWRDGRPAPETAAALGIPVAQVYVAKSRIAKRLAEELRQLGDDVPGWRGLGNDRVPEAGSSRRLARRVDPGRRSPFAGDARRIVCHLPDVARSGDRASGRAGHRRGIGHAGIGGRALAG